MEVVSLKTIPEKSTFNLKPTQQVLLKHQEMHPLYLILVSITIAGLQLH